MSKRERVNEDEFIREIGEIILGENFHEPTKIAIRVEDAVKMTSHQVFARLWRLAKYGAKFNDGKDDYISFKQRHLIALRQLLDYYWRGRSI